ncbi:MAG TPA: M23 family metallopeptidase [Chthoniobacteraceae bacterium]|nr:M23 family metallopeptidase [Chthoniobacteraceae bacterium]
MRWLLAPLFVALLPAANLVAAETANVRMADGFDCPVGQDGTKRYYKARGFRPNGHLGEDWNGAGGGDTDLGDPVYCTAHGIVVFARDFRMGWGNVVIIRHAYLEKGEPHFVDSLYGHLQSFTVAEGQTVKRGQRIGSIGNNRGMYDAHLHFEIRKDIRVGMHRHAYPRDFRTYWDPTSFIAARHQLATGATLAAVPMNTFAPTAPPAFAGTPPEPSPIIRSAPLKKTPAFKVDRFGDLRAE